MTTFKPGDLVACFITNTQVYEELLMWGIVLQVTKELKDVLVLDNIGNTHWYPSHRWQKLSKQKPKKNLDIAGILAYNSSAT